MLAILIFKDLTISSLGNRFLRITMKEINDISIAHMSMIQGVVTRLETNSFTLKTLAMTLAVAILAFAASVKNPSWIYLLSGYLPILVFWIMDAQYLRLGRLFRHLFNAVRIGEVQEPFSMNIKPYFQAEKSTLIIAFSWSICWFYLSIIVAFSSVSYILLK